MTEEAEKKPNPFENLDAIRKAAEAEMVAQARAEIANPGVAAASRRGEQKKRKPGRITLSADWLKALKKALPHPPWGVALYLAEKFRWNNYITDKNRLADPSSRRLILVANGDLKAWGVGRKAKNRDLQLMAALGLIKIEPSKLGSAPRVTWLVDPDG
jgi:hypothetical protein